MTTDKSFEEKEKDRDREWLAQWGSGPTDEQLGLIKERETQRRADYLNDRSEDEQLDFARRQRLNGVDPQKSPISPRSYEDATEPKAARLGDASKRALRDVELAGMGAVEMLIEAPSTIFDKLLEAGREYEKGFYQRRRRRIEYYDE